MYQGFYGFRERPFTLLPDPDFLFLDEKHRTALEMLETAVSARSGFCVISGEIGAGKTTLIRELLNRLDETVCVGLISNTHSSFGELLQWIMAAYGLSCGSGDNHEMHKRFVEFAVQQYAQNRRTLLIIDEAQNLTLQALEELRMLSNINSEKDLLLQVILVGQQQLRDRLQQPELEQFSKRISLRYHLQALDPDEIFRYIQHRVGYAGGEAGLFSAEACQVIYGLSGGIPRLVNRLCDLSLVYGCTAKSKMITAELVQRVGEDQRMGALQDIPRVDPIAAKPEVVEPSVDVPAPEMTEEADRLSSNTIVGAVSPALMPDLNIPASRKETATDTAVPSELHRLIVDAEHKKRSGGDRSALWLLLGVVVLVGATGWLMRDFRGTNLIAGSANFITELGYRKPEAAADDSTVPVISVDSQENQPEASLPEQQDDRQLSSVDSATPQKEPGKDSEVEDVLAQKAAKAEAAAQQRAGELRREAEEITRLKKEFDRMERERRAVEKQLVKQRAARTELERTALLEQEKLTAARETVKKLAKERVARMELERKVRLDQEKLAMAREAAKKLANERTRTEQRQVEAAAAPPEATIGAHDKDVEFAANPCDGETARFLSTCR